MRMNSNSPWNVKRKSINLNLNGANCLPLFQIINFLFIFFLLSSSFHFDWIESVGDLTLRSIDCMIFMLCINISCRVYRRSSTKEWAETTTTSCVNFLTSSDWIFSQLREWFWYLCRLDSNQSNPRFHSSYAHKYIHIFQSSKQMTQSHRSCGYTVATVQLLSTCSCPFTTHWVYVVVQVTARTVANNDNLSWSLVCFC